METGCNGDNIVLALVDFREMLGQVLDKHFQHFFLRRFSARFSNQDIAGFFAIESVLFSEVMGEVAVHLDPFRVVKLAEADGERLVGTVVGGVDHDYTRRSTIIFLISAIALAGDKPFGQALAQFMMVWQR